MDFASEIILSLPVSSFNLKAESAIILANLPSLMAFSDSLTTYSNCLRPLIISFSALSLITFSASCSRLAAAAAESDSIDLIRAADACSSATISLASASFFCSSMVLRCLSAENFNPSEIRVINPASIASPPKMEDIILIFLNLHLVCLIFLSSDSRNSFSLVRRYTIALSKAGSYFTAHDNVGLF